MTKTSKEMKSLRSFLEELGHKPKKSGLHCDNYYSLSEKSCLSCKDKTYIASSSLHQINFGGWNFTLEKIQGNQNSTDIFMKTIPMEKLKL